MNAVFFYLLKDYKLVLWCYYGLVVFLATLLFYWIVESPPIEIISKEPSPKHSYQALLRIAHWNNIENPDISFE